MPTITSTGTVQKRTGTEIIQAGKQAARALWGGSVNTRGTGSIQKILEAFVAMGVGEFENAADELYKQRHMRWATGQALDDAAWPFFYRLQPTRAVGTINLTLTSALAAPDPLFTAGSVTFTDSAGLEYELLEDIVPNGSTSVTASVRAVEAGSTGNVAADDINNPQGLSFSSPSVEADWASYVDSFTNSDPLTGGRNLETDRQFRRRIQDAPTAREGASVDGLALAIARVPGVTGVRVIENNTMAYGASSGVFVGGFTDADYDFGNLVTGGGADPKWIAQPVVLADDTDIGAIVIGIGDTVNTVSGVEVSLHADNAGDPAATPYSGMVGYTVVAPADAETQKTVPLPDVVTVPAGTYWIRARLVFHDTTEPDPLTLQWDPGTPTSPGVQTSTDGGATWAADGAVTALGLSLYHGLPPKSFEAIVSGSPDADDVAQAIWVNKAAGISPYGTTSGTATRRNGGTVEVPFSEPAEVPVVLNLIVQVTDDYGGDADTIRDLIVDYIGGTDTKLDFKDGLSVNETLVRNEIIQRLLNDDDVIGIFDVTQLYLDRKDSVTGGDPANLTSTDVDNLPSTIYEELLIDDPATDILVTLVQV